MGRHSQQRIRKAYAALMRLYPRQHQERFGESMMQTFNDLLRERSVSGIKGFRFLAWLFLETFWSIVRENVSDCLIREKKLRRIGLLTALVLLVPLIAMRFTDEVDWGLMDFALAGFLLFGAGIAFELLVSRTGVRAYQFAAGVAVAAALGLVWVNLAVGLIGNEGNLANSVYTGVLIVGVIGALLSGFSSRGMAWALIATAVAQALVAVVAWLAGWGFLWAVNGFFFALWIGSAALFRRASLQDAH